MTLADPTLVQSAQIVSVYEIQHGSALRVDMAGLPTYLDVEDLDDFSDTGGKLYLAALEIADQTTEPLEYVGLDRVLNRITLADPWLVDSPLYLAGDSVWISPAATERRADVALDGEEDQIVVARVPYSLSANIPLGVRGDHAGEWIRVRVTDYGYELDDATLEYPKTDPESISITDPDTGEEIGNIGGDASFDSVTADEIISPSVPRRNWEPQTVYVDPVSGSDDNDGVGLYPLVDTFERSVLTPAWGTSDSLHAWSVLQSDGAIDVGQAGAGLSRLRMNGANLSNVVRAAFSPLDVEVSTTFAPVSALPGAGAYWQGIAGRILDKDNLVGAAITVSTAGVHTLDIQQRQGGSWSSLGSIALGTFAVSTYFRLRLQIQTNADGGSDVRAKAWLEAGTEPDDWLLTANTSVSALQNPNGVGAFQRSGGSSTVQTSALYKDLSAGVIDADGILVPVEATGVGPYATIAAALELAGEWNDADVRLILNGVFDESIFISGLTGGGRIFINGGNAATIFGVVKLYAVHHYVELRDLTIQDTGDVGVSGTVEVRTSRHVELQNVKFQSNGLRSYNVYDSEGSNVYLNGCQLSGSTVYCLQVAEQASARALDCSGSSGSGSYRSAAAMLFVDGTKPTGATSQTAGGQIWGTNTTSGGGSAPTPNPKVTKTYTPNGSRTWRPEWAWREDNRDVYQGEYSGSGGISRGCVFYGSKLNVAGKTADSGKIYVKRRSSGGASQDQAVYLFSHDLASQPSNDSGPSIKDSGIKLGSLAWGEGKWFDIPKGVVQDMLNGTGGRKGFGLYHGSASPYVIAVPYNGGGESWKVKFTYH